MHNGSKIHVHVSGSVTFSHFAFSLPVLINNSELNSCCFFNAGYGSKSLCLFLLTFDESSPSCSTWFYISSLYVPLMLQSQVSVPGMFQMSG